MLLLSDADDTTLVPPQGAIYLWGGVGGTHASYGTFRAARMAMAVAPRVRRGGGGVQHRCGHASVRATDGHPSPPDRHPPARRRHGHARRCAVPARAPIRDLGHAP